MERGYLSYRPYTQICGSSDAAKSKCFTKITVAHLHLLITNTRYFDTHYSNTSEWIC